MEPFFAEVRDNAADKVSTIDRLLKPVTEDVAEKFQEIRQEFDRTTEKLRSVLEDKVEEFREWSGAFA